MQIVKQWIRFTDAFVYGVIRKTFSVTEKRCAAAGCIRDVAKELERFAREPLACAIGSRSGFQTHVKLRIKAVLGLFFVVLPLSVFVAAAHIADVHFVYALFATVAVAFFGASRAEEMAERYAHERMTQLNA